jgi:hypothetical protein
MICVDDIFDVPIISRGYSEMVMIDVKEIGPSTVVVGSRIA